MSDCPSSSAGADYDYGDEVDLADALILEFFGEDAVESSSDDAGARSITLAKAASRYIYNEIDGIRVRIQAIEAVGMTTKVFAYLMAPTNPTTLEKKGTFSHICSPTDLAEYPADAPVENSVPGWFRLNYVDILVRSRQEADDFIECVFNDVLALKLSLNKQEIVETIGTEEL